MDGINRRIFLLWKWGGAVYCTSANPGTFEMLYEGSVHCEKLVGVIEELKLRGGECFGGNRPTLLASQMKMEVKCREKH